MFTGNQAAIPLSAAVSAAHRGVFLPGGWVAAIDTTENLFIHSADGSAGLIATRVRTLPTPVSPEAWADSFMRQPHYQFYNPTWLGGARTQPSAGFAAAAIADVAYALPDHFGWKPMQGRVFSQTGARHTAATLVLCAARADLWPGVCPGLAQFAAGVAQAVAAAPWAGPAPVNQISGGDISKGLKDLVAIGKAVAGAINAFNGQGHPHAAPMMTNGMDVGYGAFHAPSGAPWSMDVSAGNMFDMGMTSQY